MLNARYSGLSLIQRRCVETDRRKRRRRGGGVKPARVVVSSSSALSGDDDEATKVVVFSTHAYERDILEKALSSSNCAVTFLKPRLTAETVDLAKGFDVVCAFVNDDLSSDVLERLKNFCGVGMIALRCAGFDKVDVNTCRELGVKVYRVPMYDPLSIAEHAMALILALNRKIVTSHYRVQSGNFTLDGLVGFSMRGKTLGVIGTGKIGRGLAAICAKGFGMNVLGYDLEQKDGFVGQYCNDLETVLKNSDIVSLHLPLNVHTKHFIGEKEIASMKEGAMLINTSRGALLNIKDVICGLRLGKISGLGIDVYESEEKIFFKDFSNLTVEEKMVYWDDTMAQLASLPQVLVTPHQAFLTFEALTEIAECTKQNILRFVQLNDEENEGGYRAAAVEETADINRVC